MNSTPRTRHTHTPTSCKGPRAVRTTRISCPGRGCRTWKSLQIFYVILGLGLFGLLSGLLAQAQNLHSPSSSYINPRNNQNNILLFSKANHGRAGQLQLQQHLQQQQQQQQQHQNTQGIFAAPLLSRLGGGASLNHVLHQGQQGVGVGQTSGGNNHHLDDEEVEEVEYEYYEDPNGDVVYYEDVSSSTTGNPPSSSSTSTRGGSNSGSHIHLDFEILLQVVECPKELHLNISLMTSIDWKVGIPSNPFCVA